MKFIFFLLCFLLFQFSLIANQLNECETKLIQQDFNKDFIKVIPSKGLVIKNDSILLGSTTIECLISKIDTTTITYEIKFMKPRNLVAVSMDSPPPGFTGEYKHKEDEYFTDYKATIIIDSLEFIFFYSSANQNGHTKEELKDLLKLSKIRIHDKLNVGLSEDLKIGDLEDNIYNYYDNPKIENNLAEKTWDWRENGIVFTLGLNSKDKTTYNRIIGIEINRKTRH